MVVVVAFFPRVVRSIAGLPAGGLFERFVALRAEVLVVQVVWASITTGPVIVVTGQNTIDNLGLVQNLLSFGSDLKFFAGIVLIIGFANPVFDDVARVGVVSNLARIRVVSNPLRSI